MNFTNAFKAFANRVINAVHLGHLSEKDTKTLKHLLTKTEKKNLVLSRAILSALSGAEQSEQDVKRFARLLDLASVRISEDKEPFSIEEKRELEEIFKRHSLSLRAARKFALGLDELLAMELKTQINRESMLPKKTEEEQQPVQKTKGSEKLTH